MRILTNLLLVLVSLVLVFGFTLAADRIVMSQALPEPICTEALIFPPHTHQEYETCDFKYVVDTNAIGLRGPEVTLGKSKATRVAVIGDSFVYGWGVNLEDTWVRLVEKKLNESGMNVEFINLGKPGAGPPYYAELAEKVLPLLRPDFVLVAPLQGDDMAASGPEGLEKLATTRIRRMGETLYPNTVQWLQLRHTPAPVKPPLRLDAPVSVTTAAQNKEGAKYAAQNFLKKWKPEQLAEYEKLEDKVKKAFVDGEVNPYMIDLSLQNKDFFKITLNLDDPWVKECIARMAGQFTRVKRAASLCGAKVAVVSMPHGPYVNKTANLNIRRVGYNADEAMLTSPAPDEGFKRAADKAGVPFYSVADDFRAKKDDPGLFFELDYHMTAAGNALFAEKFAPILEKLL